MMYKCNGYEYPLADLDLLVEELNYDTSYELFGEWFTTQFDAEEIFSMACIHGEYPPSIRRRFTDDISYRIETDPNFRKQYQITITE